MKLSKYSPRCGAQVLQIIGRRAATANEMLRRAVKGVHNGLQNFRFVTFGPTIMKLANLCKQAPGAAYLWKSVDRSSLYWLQPATWTFACLLAGLSLWEVHSLVVEHGLIGLAALLPALMSAVGIGCLAYMSAYSLESLMFVASLLASLALGYLIVLPPSLELGLYAGLALIIMTYGIPMLATVIQLPYVRRVTSKIISGNWK